VTFFAKRSTVVALAPSAASDAGGQLQETLEPAADVQLV
jgi:hypothetical protein